LESRRAEQRATVDKASATLTTRRRDSRRCLFSDDPTPVQELVRLDILWAVQTQGVAVMLRLNASFPICLSTVIAQRLSGR